MQSFRKNWVVASNMRRRIWWVFTQPLKSLNISFWWTLFVLSIQGLSYKNKRGVIFYDTEQWCKIWANPNLVVSKMAWEIGWTFITVQKLSSSPRNICSELWRKLTNWAAFLEIFLCLRNIDFVEHVLKVSLIVLLIYLQGKKMFSRCIWSICFFIFLFWFSCAILLCKMKLLFFS